MKFFRNKRSLFAGVVLALALTLVPMTAKAAPTVTFSMSPSGGTHLVGSTFTVTIYENSGVDEVDSVRADLTYNPGALELLDVNNAGSPFTACIDGQGPRGGNGTLTTGECTILGGKRQGQQKLGSATFKVLGNSGTTAINFSSSSQAINAGTDLAESFSNASYTMTAPAPAAPAPTKKSTSQTTPAETNVTPEETADATNPEVKSEQKEETKQKAEDNKKEDDKKETGSVWPTLLMGLVAAVLAFTLARRYTARKVAADKAKAAEAAAVAAAAKAKKSAKHDAPAKKHNKKTKKSK